MAYEKLSKEALTRLKKRAIRVTIKKNEDAKIVYFDPSIESHIVRKKGVKYISTVEDNK